MSPYQQEASPWGLALVFNSLNCLNYVVTFFLYPLSVKMSSLVTVV